MNHSGLDAESRRLRRELRRTIALAAVGLACSVAALILKITA